jgi:ribonucleotide reductase alpha subunit
MSELSVSTPSFDRIKVEGLGEVSPFRNPLAEFVYTRTYSRWMEEEGRRENWFETVDRYVDFLATERKIPSLIQDQIRTALCKMDVLPSMRALWSAGNSARRDNTTQYNCSFLPLDSIPSFSELLYILMMGTGVGFSVERQFVNNLPVVAPLSGKVVPHVVLDSTEGWADALKFGLTNWFHGHEVAFDYSLVREEGAVLKTKGGRASGPGPLIRLFEFAQATVLGATGRKLKSVEAHDIACMVGEIVVAGGVRRSALISFSDPDDEDMRHAKDWSLGSFPACRYMANNSAFYPARPSKEQFDKDWSALVASGSGERGFYMIPPAKRDVRRGDVRSNPCVTGDTRVMTPNGMFTIEDLLRRNPVRRGEGEEDNRFDINIDQRFGAGLVTQTSSLGVLEKGTKDVYRLKTFEGYSICLTEDHKVRVVGEDPRGVWKEASQLTYEDRIHIANVGEYGTPPQWEVVTMDYDKDKIPENVWIGAIDIQRDYLRYQFGDDLGVRLVSSNLEFLGGVQQLLLNFGVFSRIVGGSYLTVGRGSLRRFSREIGLNSEDAQEELVHLCESDPNLQSAQDSFTAQFESLTHVGVKDVYDIQVPVTNSFIANGIVVHNCGEILLRYKVSDDPWTGEGGGGEFCVAGDTPLITKDGLTTIQDAVGRSVEIWNGEKWSTVTPFKTGTDRQLYRVKFSDGSHLDVTKHHRFSVSNRDTRMSKSAWREMTLGEILASGVDKKWGTEPFAMQVEGGVHQDEGFAYTLGAAVGDGWVRWKSGGGQHNPRVIVGLFGEKDQVMPVVGRRGKFHVANADNPDLLKRDVFCPDQDALWLHRLKNDADAMDVMFTWDRSSILNFLAGWLDADGTNLISGGVRLYLSEESRARKVQLLLTRCGIRSTVSLHQKAGTPTNFCARKKDQWYVGITNCNDIPCHRLDTSRGHHPRIKSKFQVIKSVELLEGLHDTYCFEEPERHMGVFGNTLTYQCNLSAAVMRPEDTIKTFSEKVRIATWIGAIQSTFTHFPYLRPHWAQHCEEDRLLGVDITGQCDNPALSHNHEAMLHFNQVARETAAEATAYLGINYPAAITCGKPSGNSSQLVDCASGFHPRFASYYIRRVRIGRTDPLFRLIRDSGVPVHKDTQFAHMSDEECPTWVAEFPVKAPEGAMLRDSETAIEMLERYLHIMRTWCGERGHNQSITVYVREHEWDEVGKWVWKNFDEITGISFLPYDGGKYLLAPYEEIDEATYNEWMTWFPELDFSALSLYEKNDEGNGSVELACVGGSCEI